MLEKLRGDGYAVCNAVELLGEKICDLLDEYLFAFREHPQTVELQKAFERGEHREDVLKPHMVKTDQVGVNLSPLNEIGRYPSIVEVVCQYLVNPQFHSCNGWWFFPRPYERKRVWSESWHRDPEAARLVKTFYFPEAVDAESGPFQYIPASRHGQPLEHLAEQRKYAVCDVDALVNPASIVTCEVPARSLLMVDTSGLHRGGYTKSRGRLCANWCYVPGI